MKKFRAAVKSPVTWHQKLAQIKLAREQYEGLARFFDTLAASATIGVIVGHAGYSALKTIEIVLLYLACPTMLSLSLFLTHQNGILDLVYGHISRIARLSGNT